MITASSARAITSRRNKGIVLNKHPYFKVVWILICLVLSLLSISFVSAQASPDDFITITTDNVAQLELGYALPGTCGYTVTDQGLIAIFNVGIYDLLSGQRRAEIHSDLGEFSNHGTYYIDARDGLIDTQTGEHLIKSDGAISPNEKYYAARDDGVYEIATRKRLFSITGEGKFSPDSKLFAVENDALYDVGLGKPLFRYIDGLVTFSPNSRYMVISDRGLYDLATGKRLIKTTGSFTRYSSDSKYVAILGDGLYNIESQQKIVEIEPLQGTSFSPDNKTVAITGNGVYDLATGERKFPVDGYELASPDYVEGTPWLIVDEDGIYNLTTGEKYFSINGSYNSANQDASLIMIYKKGIYDTATGQQKFEIRGGRFVLQDKLITSNLYAPPDMPDGLICGVYGVKGDKWPYRSGLVNTSNTQLYSTPNGDIRLDSQGLPMVTDKQHAVLAQTSDKQWFRISVTSWVKASDVQPVSLPDGIPIENPS